VTERAQLLRGLAAAVLVAAAVGLPALVLTGPARAATCADSGGVSVVVDFKSLGGGAQSLCDADGGGQNASVLFTDNGYELTYAQRTPGFVCRVQGLPTPDQDPCINTSPSNAYWGVWWSDGKKGKWTYSTLGVGSLTIPAGGSVALAWDDLDGQSKPGVAPPKTATATPSPSPTVKPTPTPTPTPVSTPKPTPTVAPSESPAPTPTETPTETPTPTPTATESATPTSTPTPSPSESESPSDPAADEVEPTNAAADADDGGLPAWVPIAVLVALFGAAAVAAAVRRRRA
jgi:hypothetical protein